MGPSLFRIARILILGVCLAMVAGRAAPPRQLLLDVARTSDALIAVGERGSILRSVDDGANWQPAAVSVTATLTAVDFATDGQHGWAVGHDALILTTTDGGRTWREAYRGENSEDSFLDVCVLDRQTIIVVGAYGQYHRSTDGGQTWTAQRLSEDDYHFNRITRATDGSLYLAGEHGTLLRSRDRGENWEGIHAPYDGSFYGILPISNGGLLAYGLRGRIYRSANAGDDWDFVANERRVLIACALQLRSGVIVLAGQPRAFFVSHDDGHTFSPWAASLTTGVAELIEADDGTLLALGEAGVTRLSAPPANP
jgi:photosystem II stability/assembly factor-like uncharacterized protein